MRYKIKMDGMSCGHCKMAARTALEGVREIEVENVEIGEAVIQTEDLDAAESLVRNVLEEEGYPLVSIEAADA